MANQQGAKQGRITQKEKEKKTNLDDIIMTMTGEL